MRDANRGVRGAVPLGGHPTDLGDMAASGRSHLELTSACSAIGTGAMKPNGVERSRSWWSAAADGCTSAGGSSRARMLPPTDPGYEAARRQTQTLF